MRGKALSEEIKARIVADLLIGKRVADIAREHSVPTATVQNFKRSLPARELTQVNAARRDRLDELLVEAVAANFAAQAFILDAVRDIDYLRKYDPEKVGILFGQIGDRAVRILEVAGPFLAAQSEESD